MRKNADEKIEIRVHGFINADIVEWQRHTENPDLVREVKKTQKSYGLPVPITRGVKHISARDVFDWMGWREPVDIDTTTGELILGPKSQRREKLRSVVNDLMIRFEIPSKFYDSLHSMVVVGDERLHKLSAGFPSFSFRKDTNGKLVHMCTITPETDLGNPVVLDFIKQWQVLHRDEIPSPQPMRGDKRKLDWRPVWEWRNRHPDVSDVEISKKLGKNRVTVSRAFEKLDKENALQNS